MNVMERVAQVKGVAVKVAGFVTRHRRVSIAVTAALLLTGPLATGGGAAFFLNAIGLGIGLMALRRFMVRPRMGKLRR